MDLPRTRRYVASRKCAILTFSIILIWTVFLVLYRGTPSDLYIITTSQILMDNEPDSRSKGDVCDLKFDVTMFSSDIREKGFGYTHGVTESTTSEGITDTISTYKLQHDVIYQKDKSSSYLKSMEFLDKKDSDQTHYQVKYLKNNFLTNLIKKFRKRRHGKAKRRFTTKGLKSMEKKLILDLAEKAVQVFTNLKASYMMYAGTLLGSYRHHDIIPWDTDIDFLVNSSFYEDVYYGLADKVAGYDVEEGGVRMKYFSKYSPPAGEMPWNFPFLDISFFDENDTHIWDNSVDESNFIYDKSEVFPMHLRPLGPLKLLAPRDSLAVLRVTYTNHQCQTHTYDHREEAGVWGPQRSVTCEDLKDTIPFVRREPVMNGMNETLYLGDEALHSIIIDEPPASMNKPYSLELLTSD